MDGKKNIVDEQRPIRSAEARSGERHVSMPARANLQTAQQGNLSSPMSTDSKEHWIAAAMRLQEPIICLLKETELLLISFAIITLPSEALWLASGRISTSFEQ